MYTEPKMSFSIENGNLNLCPNGFNTIIQPAATANRTITVPDITCTLVCQTSADNLTNKTVTDSTNNVTARGLWADSGTGSVSIYAATAPTTGQVLTATNSTTATWQSPAATGITTLNTLTGATQTFATGTSGTDFGIVSSGTSHTFNIPDASASNRGLLTTGSQTVSGVKTFSSAPNLSSLTVSQAIVTDGSKNMASLAYTAAATASTIASRDTNANTTFANVIEGYTTTVTAVGTTTLTVASNYQQFFTGSTTQTVVLPVTSTLVLGQSYSIANVSTGVVTVQSSGANTIQTMASNSLLIVTCILTSGTTAASWSGTYIPSFSTLTFPTSVDTMMGRATTDSCTNKSLVNASCFHVDGTDATKKIGFQSSSATTATTLTIADQQTTSQTLSVPNISGADTLMTLGTTQTVTGIKSLPDGTNTVFYDQSNSTNTLFFNVNGTGNHQVQIYTQASGSALDTVNIPDLTGATDTFAMTTLAQTLASKSLTNATNFFVDGTTPTKKIGFQSSGATASTTLTIASQQTTSQTLSVPNITGADTVATTSLAQTLASKSLTNATNFFVDGTDATKKIGFQSSGATTATTLTIASQQTTSQTLSVPNVSSGDTIATINATQTLTNKTITGSTNTVAASQLRTAGADVVVSAASAPSTGQALIAASATTASWQNISGITWRNTWNSGTTYAVNDCISSGGSTWICILSHTNQVPPNATYWNMVVDGFHWKGTWNSGTAYIVNDVVSLSGTTYICILGNTNNTPPNATYWTVFVATTPAGSTTQVQYNNAGAIAGTANLTIASDSNCIFGEVSGAAPTAPSAGAKVYAKFRAGRRMLAQIGPSGIEYSMQPCIFSNKILWFSSQGNATTVTSINFGNTVTGTATARNVATTNIFTSMRRVGYVSAATAGSSAGTRHAAQQFWTGNASGLGGFFVVCRFGISSASTVAAQRSFVGLLASTAAPANADMSSNTGTAMLGFGVDTADSTWTFMHGNGTTVTKDALTGTFPPRDLSVSMFEARIFCAPNSTTIYYSLEVLNGGSLYEGSATTTLPSNTTLLSPIIWTNNGSTALACGIDVVSLYIETDN
jgi:hypothetical protein